MPWAWANTRASSTGFDRGAGLTGPPPDQDFVYVNDFPNSGRLSQVIVQADAPARMHVENVLRIELRSAERSMVPLSQVVTPVWEAAALQLDRYDGYPAARISGSAANGVSSGAAMTEIETPAKALPAGVAVEWTGQSLQEKQSATQAPIFLAVSMLVVFLVLAVLYESWSVPFAVMPVVPLGLLGSAAAVWLRGMDNDVFFKVGLITIIGLSAKARRQGQETLREGMECGDFIQGSTQLFSHFLDSVLLGAIRLTRHDDVLADADVIATLMLRAILADQSDLDRVKDEANG